MRETTKNSYSPSSNCYVGLIFPQSELILDFGTIPGSIMTLETPPRSDFRPGRDPQIRDARGRFTISPKFGSIWTNFSFWRHSLVDYDPEGAG